MARGFTARSRERLRSEILEAAAAEIVEKGWRGLRMQAIADRVGVSRQTLNNEFSSKDGLAQELVLAIGSTYCDLHEQVLATAPDPTAAVRETVCLGLSHAAANHTFRAVLAPDGSDTFLPLYTNAAKPLLDLFTARLTTMWRSRWPHIDPDRLRICIDAGNRLTVSHVLCPDRTPEHIADDFAQLFGTFLSGA
jgi:AcrR family transcriptional regulator